MFESLLWSISGLFLRFVDAWSAGKHISLRDSSVLYAFSRGKSAMEHISLRSFKRFVCFFPRRVGRGAYKFAVFQAFYMLLPEESLLGSI